MENLGLITVKSDVALSVACKLLSDSLPDYFAVEESIAQALNFDFTQHRQAHQNLKSVSAFKRQVNEPPSSKPRGIQPKEIKAK
jgi:hypothetical protein